MAVCCSFSSFLRYVSWPLWFQGAQSIVALGHQDAVSSPGKTHDGFFEITFSHVFPRVAGYLNKEFSTRLFYDAVGEINAWKPSALNFHCVDRSYYAQSSQPIHFDLDILAGEGETFMELRTK